MVAALKFIEPFNQPSEVNVDCLDVYAEFEKTLHEGQVMFSYCYERRDIIREISKRWPPSLFGDVNPFDWTGGSAFILQLDIGEVATSLYLDASGIPAKTSVLPVFCDNDARDCMRILVFGKCKKEKLQEVSDMMTGPEFSKRFYKVLAKHEYL